MREDHQPLNTAPSKVAAKASIYIFIPLLLVLGFSGVAQGTGVFAVFRRLLSCVFLFARIFAYFMSSSSSCVWALSKREILYSMNNVPTGDGIKKHWDFHINSISLELQRAYYASDTWIHFPHRLNVQRLVIQQAKLFYCSEAFLSARVEWRQMEVECVVCIPCRLLTQSRYKRFRSASFSTFDGSLEHHEIFLWRKDSRNV